MSFVKKALIGVLSLLAVLIATIAIVFINFFKVYPPLKEYPFTVEVTKLRAVVDEVIARDTTMQISRYTEFYYKDKWQATLQIEGSDYSYLFQIKRMNNRSGIEAKSEIDLVSLNGPHSDIAIYRRDSNQGIDIDACIEEFSTRFVDKIQKRLANDILTK